MADAVVNWGISLFFPGCSYAKMVYRYRHNRKFPRWRRLFILHDVVADNVAVFCLNYDFTMFTLKRSHLWPESWDLAFFSATCIHMVIYICAYIYIDIYTYIYQYTYSLKYFAKCWNRIQFCPIKQWCRLLTKRPAGMLPEPTGTSPKFHTPLPGFIHKVGVKTRYDRLTVHQILRCCDLKYGRIRCLFICFARRSRIGSSNHALTEIASNQWIGMNMHPDFVGTTSSLASCCSAIFP